MEHAEDLPPGFRIVDPDGTHYFFFTADMQPSDSKHAAIMIVNYPDGSSSWAFPAREGKNGTHKKRPPMVDGE